MLVPVVTMVVEEEIDLEVLEVHHQLVKVEMVVTLVIEDHQDLVVEAQEEYLYLIA